MPSVAHEHPLFWKENGDHQSVAALFADSIDHLYRVAIAVDPSPHSQIAYACYLAEHHQPLESFREFDEILNHTKVAEDPEMLAEIVRRLSDVERRLENDDACNQLAEVGADWKDFDSHQPDGSDDDCSTEAICEVADGIRQLMNGTRQRSPRDFSRIIAELDLHTLEDVGELLWQVHHDRALRERRRTGMSLLKLALFCGKRGWCHVEVESIREAIRCFAQVVMEISNGRHQARAELAAISMQRV
jgi:hypothetical protein